MRTSSITAPMLGLALVYLGEHYVVDLVAGAALTVAVRRLGPSMAPVFARIGRPSQPISTSSRRPSSSSPSSLQLKQWLCARQTS